MIYIIIYEIYANNIKTQIFFDQKIFNWNLTFKYPKNFKF